MADNTTLEYFLSLLDEGERVLSSDPLAEMHSLISYKFKNEDRKPVIIDIAAPQDKLTVSDCRACHAWINRVQYIPPKESARCKVMCIISSPKVNRLLSPKGEMFFLKWFQGINIDINDVALTTLVKCPMQDFSVESANACKDFLREEMEKLKPDCLYLLGEDVAKYMLRRNMSIEQLRGKRYKINNIPTFVSYSPEDLVEYYTALRAPVWDDLQFLRNNL